MISFEELRKVFAFFIPAALALYIGVPTLLLFMFSEAVADTKYLAGGSILIALFVLVYILRGLYTFYLSVKDPIDYSNMTSLDVWLASSAVIAVTVSLCAVPIVAFAWIFAILGVVDTSTNLVTHDPGTALYFSAVTWTTLGYGDFRPTIAARAFAATEAVFGYLVMIVIVALLGNCIPRASSHT